MPYIKQEDRNKFHEMLSKCPEIKTKGELEFVLFKLAKMYMSNKEYRYTTLHDLTYSYFHVGHEIARRLLDKREDQAILENGDI